MWNAICRKLFVFVIGTASLGLTCISPLDASAAGEEKPVVRLAHIADFEPFAVSKEGGSEGLAVDIIAAALERVGVKAVFIGEHQDRLEEMLSQGKIDGLAFLGINPERRQKFDFSKPYLITGGALFVRKSGEPTPDLKDLQGKTVATPEKGPLAGFIRKCCPEVKLLTDVKDYTETLKVVLEGRADAAALNTQSGAVLAKKLFPDKFTMPQKGFMEVPIGVGVGKGKQSDFIAKFDQGLNAILSDGTYDRILEKWGAPGATKPRK